MILPPVPEHWKDWAELLAYVVTIAGAIVALWQFRKNSARERTAWLFELYKQFYGNVDLRELRVRIDLGDTAFIEKDSDHALLGKLDDFLNFFEFIAYLEQHGELTIVEIREMFEYPLKTVAANKRVLAYVSRPDYGYEKLPALLKKLG